MRVIDADTHVDETEDTWSHLRDEERHLMPQTTYPSKPDPTRPPARYWNIGGKRQIRFIRSDQQTQTTVQTRELLDVDARLRDMDRMNVEVQVIYPTLFIVEFTDKPELGLALRRSYNRWLAERCSASLGRLRWVMLPPLHSIGEAIAELRWAKEHGAVGVLKKGDDEAGHWPSEEYYFPLYEEAERLGMPICFHTGTGIPDTTPARQRSHNGFYRILLPVAQAFQGLILHDVPAKFPKLRWGFIEASASWIPFVLYLLRRQLEKRERLEGTVIAGPDNFYVADDVMQRYNLYVSCQIDEDLPYLLKLAGEDNLVVGSDYTHNDSAMEMDFAGGLQQRADRGEIPRSAVQKIVYDNAKALYGL